MSRYHESRPLPVETTTLIVDTGDPTALPGPHWMNSTRTRGYQIGEWLGEGGVGIVYKAYQAAIGREVAIKVLRQKYARDVEFIRRFQTEAEIVARLEHPHIIPLYDYWHDDDGIYIVMRWLRGGSVRDALDKAVSWSLHGVAQLLDQVAGALSVAHNVGIIHRDLKPDNVLLDEQGNAYLTDFGLAKNLLAGSAGDVSNPMMETLLKQQKDFFKKQPTSTLFITDAQQIYGTPAYVSPEQIRYEALSPQTDIYSLGIMLYELIVGTAPFTGTLVEIMAKHITHEVSSIHSHDPAIPEAVDHVISTATAKNPGERYPDVLSFAKAFREACS